MEDRIRLSYFYGKEADQFSFYKIPKLLFTEEYFKKISVEAKVLYGLMLDRMSLSMKNQWMDDEGRAYIYYSLEDIMEALGCSNKKAISIMKELDTDAGIGLIEKKRQGFDMLPSVRAMLKGDLDTLEKKNLVMEAADFSIRRRDGGQLAMNFDGEMVYGIEQWDARIVKQGLKFVIPRGVTIDE